MRQGRGARNPAVTRHSAKLVGMVARSNNRSGLSTAEAGSFSIEAPEMTAEHFMG